MNMIPVKSSAVTAIGHDGDVLTVQYPSGLYRLEGVTAEQFADLLASDSIGREINALKILGAFTKVEPEEEA